MINKNHQMNEVLTQEEIKEIEVFEAIEIEPTENFDDVVEDYKFNCGYSHQDAKQAARISMGGNF